MAALARITKERHRTILDWLLSFTLLLIPVTTAWSSPPEGGGPKAKAAPAAKEARELEVVVASPGEEHKAMRMVLLGEHARRGFLGVQLLDLTPELRRHFGVPEETGVLVSRVEAESPADRAGVQVGDLLTAIDGEAVSSPWDVRRTVRKKAEGESLVLEVWRNGRVHQLTTTVVERERPEFDIAPLIRRRHGEAPVISMDLQRMHEVMKELHEKFGGQHFQHLQKLNSELEQRLKELEARLKQLEDRLQMTPPARP